MDILLLLLLKYTVDFVVLNIVYSIIWLFSLCPSGKRRMCLLLFRMFPCFTSHATTDNIACLPACLLTRYTNTHQFCTHRVLQQRYLNTTTSATHVYASHLPSWSKLHFLHRYHHRYQWFAIANTHLFYRFSVYFPFLCMFILSSTHLKLCECVRACVHALLDVFAWECII